MTKEFIEKLKCNTLDDLYQNQSMTNLIDYSTDNPNRLLWFIHGSPGVGKTLWSKLYHNYLNGYGKYLGTYTICKTNGTCVRSAGDVRLFVDMIFKSAMIKKGYSVNTYVFDEAHDFTDKTKIWGEFKSLSDGLDEIENPGVRLIFLSNENENIIADKAFKDRVNRFFNIEDFNSGEAIEFLKLSAKQANIGIPNKETDIRETLIDPLSHLAPRIILNTLEDFSKGSLVTNATPEILKQDLLKEMTENLINWINSSVNDKINLHSNDTDWIDLVSKLYLKWGVNDEALLNRYSSFLQRAITHWEIKFDSKSMLLILSALLKIKRNTVGSFLTLLDEIETQLVTVIKRKQYLQNRGEKNDNK